MLYLYIVLQYNITNITNIYPCAELNDCVLFINVLIYNWRILNGAIFLIYFKI